MASKTSWSPSSRRAWIEIGFVRKLDSYKHVALLAEGVDRNCAVGGDLQPIRLSPSSQRAWIEIDAGSTSTTVSKVALLAEGVDRNNQPAGVNPDQAVALLAEGVDRNW